MTAIGLGPKSRLMLILLTLIGLGMFGWPFVVPAGTDVTTTAAPYLFMLLAPLLLVLVLAQMADGGLDAKALAILGVLSAVNAALRPLGAGLGGVETVFFLLILAGRVFGPGFGFALGATSIMASGLLTAGVGPWLPFQMLASAWLGLGAGLLPRRFGRRPIRGPAELVMLIVYGIVAAYLYGALLNLWFWPYITGATMGDQADLAYIPGGAFLTNLKRFGVYSLITSTAVWDTGRAVTNSLLLGLTGLPVLAMLRRTLRRANFAPAVVFDDPGLSPAKPVTGLR